MVRTQRVLADVSVPTPYESPQSYSILTGLADDILTALAEDVVLQHPPIMGSLPVGWPMALLLRVPGSTEHLAIVDEGFTTFANLLAKACAQGLMPDPTDDSEEAWKAGFAKPTHPGVVRYVQLITASLRNGPATAPVQWPDPEWREIALVLLAAIEQFVVAAPFAQLADGIPEASPVLPVPAIHPRAESYELDESQRTQTFRLRVGLMASVFDRLGYVTGAVAVLCVKDPLNTRSADDRPTILQYDRELADSLLQRHNRPFDFRD